MKRKTRSLSILLVLTLVLAMLIPSGAQAASAKKTTKKKAAYVMKEESETYEGARNIQVNYSFQYPKIKGKTQVVKKINKSLRKAYREAQEIKKSCYEYADDLSLGTTEVHDGPQVEYFTTQECKETYNQKGYLSFQYTGYWYSGGVSNNWIGGYNYSLRTGKELKLTDVMAGSATKIKNKIIRKYLKTVNNSAYAKDALETMSLSEFDFYLKNGKVIVCFGPYQPGGGNGVSTLTFKGNYA